MATKVACTKNDNLQKITNYLYLFLCLIAFSACSTKKLVQNGGASSPNLKKRSSKYLQKKLAANELKVDWLNARAKITFKDAEQTRKFNANIRMRSDSVIWMNVKKLSVEAFRILIDQDSIYIIDRLEKKYYVRGLNYVEEQFNFFGQFQALQTAILGNPYFLEKQKLSAGIVDGKYQLLSGDESRTRSEYLLDGLTYILSEMSFFDIERDRKMTVELAGYETVGDNFSFPHDRTFLINSEETGDAKIEMDFSKVEINVPKSIKFSVSSRYKRVDTDQ